MGEIETGALASTLRAFGPSLTVEEVPAPPFLEVESLSLLCHLIMPPEFSSGAQRLSEALCHMIAMWPWKRVL